MSDSSGDQGFLPDTLTDYPLPYLAGALGFSSEDAGTPPSKYRNPVVTTAISNIMRNVDAVRTGALKQQSMPPGKSAPITRKQLSFLAACRKQFEERDGKEQRRRLAYVSFQPQFSESPLEKLVEGAPRF